MKDNIFYWKMLKSALMTLIKGIIIEILYWKMVKSDKFDF